tara:strand:- start:476 stop:646 length:171 start_codon:yes stop_codon:yes gene_type:complete
MDTFTPQEKAKNLLASAMGEVAEGTDKSQVKLGLTQTIEANIQYWAEVKNSLEELA